MDSNSYLARREVAAAGCTLPVSAPATTSVIVCSHRKDRFPDVQSVLHSLGNQSVQPDEVILVIDHEPELGAMVEERLLPTSSLNVRLVENNRQPGIVGARNSGLDAARGAIVMFLDDDASPHALWVERLRVLYQDPSVMAAGGRAVPSWHLNKPTWFPDEFAWVIGCSSEAEQLQQHEVSSLVGCNMSFRSSVLDRSAAFEDCIEWPGENGRERELCQRLQTTHPDRKIILEPSAEVRHRVRQEQSSFSYYLRRCLIEGFGRSNSREVSRRTLIQRSGKTLTKLLGAFYRSLRKGPGSLLQVAVMALGAATVATGFALGIFLSCPRLRQAPIGSPLLAQ